MERKFKIVLINHSFQKEYYYRRWQLFAKDHPNVDVYLLTPNKVKWYSTPSYTFNGPETVEGHAVDDGNFHILLFRLNIFGWSWFSSDYSPIFKHIQPDIIYHIGTHRMLSLIQVSSVAKRVCPQAKLMLFSMRGPANNLKLDKSKCSIKEWITRRIRFILMSFTWSYVKKHYSTIFCHYPDAIQCFIDEGFTGHLYMQTQVGVNEEWFHEDFQSRQEIRRKYSIDDDTFVFGSATRFTPDKRVDVILKALPSTGNWKYLMMGAGSDLDRSRLISIIRNRNLEDHVIETGFIDNIEISKYWNAIDCAIHVPITTPTWVETFSLAAIQPQITKKPVIGSDSGSVPYQIGFEDMIVPEGDVHALRDKITWVLDNKSKLREMGERMYQRTKHSFEIKHLNDLFYKTLLDELDGIYDINKVDMTQV